MHRVEVQLELYIFYSKSIQQISSVLPHPEAELSASAGLVLCVRVSYSRYFLLPLAIVSECADKLTAYLCRAAEDQQVVSEPYKRHRQTNRWR